MISAEISCSLLTAQWWDRAPNSGDCSEFGFFVKIAQKWLRNSAFRWSDTYLLIILPFFENMAQELLRIMPVLSNWLRNYSDFLGNYQDLWWNDTGITQNIASLEKMTQKKLRNLLENIVRDNSVTATSMIVSMVKELSWRH